ncbi:hypothetical protein [Streptomyces sp. MN13]
MESGSGYKITMSWRKGVSSSPVELGKGAMNPSATIELGGADNGTMTVTGPANQEAIPADTPIKISDLSGTYTPENVALGGADEGTVHVEGPGNSEPIKAGEPIEIQDLKGTYRPGASGESTLSPGVLTIEALGTTTTCAPERTEVSLTLDTTGQPGGAAGGSGGGLAGTGSEDHATLKALALAAGTITLVGTALLTFLPGRRTP